MRDLGIWALWYLTVTSQMGPLGEGVYPYGRPGEEEEARELAAFLKLAASREAFHSGRNAALTLQPVRITRTLRVYIGKNELKARPMAKSILLLFLRHPEGIALKDILDYREELTILYGRVTRSLDRELVLSRVARVLDIFNNELNVNISRVNAAMAALVDAGQLPSYGIRGKAGAPKAILLDRSCVVWEGES